MNEKYERLTVTASDGSVGIRRGYSKDDLIARLVELEDEKERFYPEFDFDNDIKPVKEQTTKTGVFYNEKKIWNSRKTI